jgi:hypothetical protein
MRAFLRTSRRFAAVAVTMSAAAGALSAQDAPGKLHYTIAPSVLGHLSGSQASPLRPSSDGTVKMGFGVDVAVERASASWPLELRLGWTMHDQEGAFSTRNLEGDTHFIRAMLSTHRMLGIGLSQPLKFEVGAGLLHARTESVVPRLGQNIGLPGVSETVRVVETSPMIGTAVSYKFWQGASFGAAARLGLDIAFSEGASTFLLPFGIQFTR